MTSNRRSNKMSFLLLSFAHVKMYFESLFNKEIFNISFCREMQLSNIIIVECFPAAICCNNF